MWCVCCYMWQFLFWPPDGHLPPLEWPENSRQAENHTLHSLTTPSLTGGDTQTKRALEGGRGRESCFCPFLDIVDNLNNRDKFQSTLLCVIARGYVCLSKQACNARCCVHLPHKVRDKDRAGEKKSTVADS